MDVFDKMCPLFFNADVGIDEVGPPIKTYAEERGELKSLLVAGRKAGKVLFMTPLFHWYIAHGLVVTKVYQVIQYERSIVAPLWKTGHRPDAAATSKGPGPTPNCCPKTRN